VPVIAAPPDGEGIEMLEPEPEPGPDRTVVLTEMEAGWTKILGHSPGPPLFDGRDAHEVRGERDEPALPSSAVPDEAIPFGRAMWLTNAEVSALEEGEGAELVVDLTWLAERAHASDYTVSVQVHGDGWRAQHDGTPALGAIPTLKWLAGMRVRDRHRIPLPAGVDADAPYHITVGVYDAFSLEPLPVTRRDLAAQGQGQSVVIHDTRAD
jgi:hypothetical protein